MNRTNMRAIGMMAFYLLFSSFVFAHMTPLVAGPVATQIFEPDHYLSYDVQAAPHSPVRVTLRDQFIGPKDFIVEKPIKLLNPTLKRHNNQVFEIKYPKLHYTSYQLKPLEDVVINSTVLVFNQFGQFIFNEFRPSRLLAPTRKILTPLSGNPAEDLKPRHTLLADHYLCYDVLPQTVTTQFGYLRDQFRARTFENLIVRRLCNPVAKRHANRDFDIIHNNETNHLLCFELPKKRILKFASLVDQFGAKGAVFLNDDELCVPSIKFKLSGGECEGSLPDFDGQCNGSCPTPSQICLPDPATQLCRCADEVPSQCVDTTPGSDGQCNGECPPNQLCVADLTNDSCQCQEILEPCAISADGICGGSCPAGEICINIPGANDCDCVAE